MTPRTIEPPMDLSVPLPPMEITLPPVDAEPAMTDEAVIERLARVDDHLRKWRTETVDRRSAYDQQQDAVLQRRRKQVLQGLAAASAVVVGVIALWALQPQDVVAPELQPQDLQPQDLEQVPVEPLQPQDVAKAAALQPQDVEPVEPLQPQDVVQAAALQPQDLDTLQPQDVVEPPPPLQPQDVGTAEALQPQDIVSDGVFVVEPGTFKLWQEGRLVHVEFGYQADGPLTLRWEDAAGKRVLGEMQCNGAQSEGLYCHKARTLDRLRWEQTALGATPGTWTVLGCRDAQCAPLGTFEVASAL